MVHAGLDVYVTYVADESGIQFDCAVLLPIVGRNAEHCGSLIESKRRVFHEVKN